MTAKVRLEELFDLVRQIPAGRVMGYGQVGRQLSNPVSGLLVGRWMGSSPPDVPWWRVIGADGSLKTYKSGPEHGLCQRLLLESEGVVFFGDRVPASYFWGD